ncbi:hypothetical protein QR90_13600 [Deinococcus radiopugnans]|uniref:Uncharacterized protein n=1 Tax=Deinococcus radiopugnans TaxID=57497 RepID=A0A0A7KMP6_9DEIO|nr:hypothetical protein [Deinococcus radiopugnans]AIZ45883.1 hypothetical protein QR90_13600 [Deinococcus radiopugnans]
MKPQTLLSALSLTLLLAACAGPQAPGTANGANPVPGSAEDLGTRPVAVGPDTVEPAFDNVPVVSGHVHAPDPAPTFRDLPRDARLGAATIPRGTRLSAQALPANAQTDKVELRVLVLSSGEGDFGLDSAKAMLQQSGVPYDVLDASGQTLDQSRLINADGTGKYQGVILTTNALINESTPGVFTSTLDSGEWDTLFAYEAAYKVRQLALYGYPGVAPEDYGLRAVAGAETSTTSMTPNAAGKGIFTDLTGTALPIQYAYSYPSALEPVTGVTTTPLLTDPQGRVLAATSTAADGRERLLITTAQNAALLHTQLLGYGLVQWLTKGVHLGEHRRFLQVDIDDFFSAGDHLNSATGQLYAKPFRVSAGDLISVDYQQNDLRKDFKVASQFRYALVFNGGGAKTSSLGSCLFYWLGSDQLTSISKCLKNDFDWVNHTKDHLRLDVIDYKTASEQIAGNFTIGSKLGLPVNRKSLVTGEHSGLGNMDPSDDGTHNDDDVNLPKQDLGLARSNPNMLAAADSAGVRYLGADHSVASQWDASCVTCGVQHPLNPNLFLVPRWPINMHYHVTNPAEVLKSYNSIYAPGGTRPYWDHALSYTEFLDKESDLALNHMLGGGAFPHYLHQTNLNQYALGKSVASDWVRAALTKYSRYSTLPLNTYHWDQLGDYLKSHTLEEKAKAAGTLGAVWDRTTNVVAISSRGGSVPATLTGANSGTAYGAYRALSSTVNGTVNVAVTPR